MAIKKIKGIRFIHNVTTDTPPPPESMGEVNVALNLYDNKMYYKDAGGQVRHLSTAFNYDSSEYAGRQVDVIDSDADIIAVCNHAYNAKTQSGAAAELPNHINIDVFSHSTVVLRNAGEMIVPGVNQFKLSYTQPLAFQRQIACHGHKIERVFEVTLPDLPAGMMYNKLCVRRHHLWGYPGMTNDDVPANIVNMVRLDTWLNIYNVDKQDEYEFWNRTPENYAAYAYCDKAPGLAYLEFYVEVVDANTGELVLGQQDHVVLTASVHSCVRTGTKGYIDNVSYHMPEFTLPS